MISTCHNDSNGIIIYKEELPYAGLVIMALDDEAIASTI